MERINILACQLKQQKINEADLKVIYMPKIVYKVDCMCTYPLK